MAKLAARSGTHRRKPAAVRKLRVVPLRGAYTDGWLRKQEPSSLLQVCSPKRLLLTICRVQQERNAAQFNLQEAERERDAARSGMASDEAQRMATTMALALCDHSEHVRVTAEEYLALERALGCAGLDLLDVLNTEPGLAEGRTGLEMVGEDVGRAEPPEASP
jgi:hypothetical protein